MADLLPDTLVVAEALALVEAALPVPLLRHSLRTFRLGSAYAERKGIAFDREDFALAALFHDIGLTPSHRRPLRPFPFASSAALGAFLAGRRTRDRVVPLQEAIEYHMQLRPRWRSGPVAGLLQVGAWMDVTRLRAWTIWSDVREADRAFPRTGFLRTFSRCLLASCADVPSAVGLVAPGIYRSLQDNPHFHT